MADAASATGKPLSRVDGPLKVTGAAPYAADYPAAGLLHGAIVSSRIARGRITAIDTAEALAFPGVVAVFTHENRPKAAQMAFRYKDMAAPPGGPFRPLAGDEILFADQPVAVVIAETYEAARDAVGLVRVAYEAAPFCTDLEAMHPDSYEPSRRRLATKRPPKDRGDFAAAFAAAPIKVAATYRTSPEYHNPMEPFATTAVWGADGRLTVYDKNQGSQTIQMYLSMSLGMRPRDIRVINAYVGGAFGSGLRPSHAAFLAALSARRLQRPVRIVMTRAQMFSQTYRPHAVQHMQLACDSEGRLQAIRHEAIAATSTHEDQQEVVVNWSGVAYACRNVDLDYRLAQLATPTPGDMRAPGAATGVFALECAMDELAEAAGRDPLELRLANWVDYDQTEDKPITSKALRECYAQAAERFGWARRTPAPRSMRDGRELVGWGMAGGIWDAMVAPVATRARATWRADGRLEIAAAASDIGTGTYTILAQIAAESFGIAADRVDVRLGDSTLPYNPLEGGSWMAASTGAATARACANLKKALVKAARSTHQGPRRLDDLVFDEGRVSGPGVPGGALDIADIVRAAGKDIAATGTTLPDLPGMRRTISYTHSAAFVEVRVDAQLGVVRVTRVVTAIAAGRILNPKTARSQILGGVVMGIGKALHEEGVFDHRFGRVMNHNLADYHVPAHADVHDIEVIFVEENDPKVSPLGVKGVGEIGIVAVPPAIANAVYHATGERIRSLPITPDKLLGATG